MAQGRAKKKRKHYRPELAGPEELKRLAQAREAAAKVQDLIRTLGKEVARKVFGELGPQWGTKFRDLEILSQVLGDSFATSFVATALGDQSQQAVPESHECCPACQASGAPTAPEPADAPGSGRLAGTPANLHGMSQGFFSLRAARWGST